MSVSEKDAKKLQEELEQFCREKEKIKNLIGQIGGKTPVKKDRFLNTLFVCLIALFFSFDIARYLLGIEIALPPLFSIEIGLLLVSVKIIWMIHKQAKVEHFQFWILNSIEFRINDISRRISKLETFLKGGDNSC